MRAFLLWSREHWRQILVYLAVVAYFVAFFAVQWRAVPFNQGMNHPCLALDDISTPAGWKRHRVLATTFWPLFWLQGKIRGTDDPCSNEPLTALSAATPVDNTSMPFVKQSRLQRDGKCLCNVSATQSVFERIRP